MMRTLTITNRTADVRPVYVEPEGAVYWMRPDEKFELRAEARSERDGFELWDNGDSLQIWPSDGMGFISVFEGERELECGHQCPAGQ